MLRWVIGKGASMAKCLKEQRANRLEVCEQKHEHEYQNYLSSQAAKNKYLVEHQCTYNVSTTAIVSSFTKKACTGKDTKLVAVKLFLLLTL